MKSYNYNECVKFRLGADGRKVLADFVAKEKSQFQDGHEFIEVIERKYSPDENHMIKMQMWEMMKVFGTHFSLGKEMFAGGSIYFDDNQLKNVDET